MIKEKNLRFEVKRELPKTKIYLIISNHSNEELGTIYWFPTWRRYVSETFSNIVVDSSCHKEISEFLDKLMEDRNGRAIENP